VAIGALITFALIISTVRGLCLPTNIFLRIAPSKSDVSLVDTILSPVLDRVPHRRNWGNMDGPLWLELGGYATTRHMNVYVPTELAYVTNKRSTNFAAKLNNHALAKLYEQWLTGSGLSVRQVGAAVFVAPEGIAAALSQAKKVDFAPYRGPQPFGDRTDVPYSLLHEDVFILTTIAGRPRTGLVQVWMCGLLVLVALLALALSVRRHRDKCKGDFRR
jgi:hypothetical protein